MSKFNTVLNGRPTAREAFLRLQQIINGSVEKEDITLDFMNVEVLTPSYADELLRALEGKYGSDKIKIINTSQAVLATIQAVK
ncbi:STAS-like domain-containing protein [Candidatus Parcubacteria bacterium]|nr:STAS-like domain-containing protein [Candidatus Parcubacteria bacterium]